MNITFRPRLLVLLAACSFSSAFAGERPALPLDVAAIDQARILKAAEAALKMSPVTVTSQRAKLSESGLNDFYSNVDYWWPDPGKPDGLPYIQRDGESNPGNFTHHRIVLRDMRDAVAALGAAYKITREDRFAAIAAELWKKLPADPTDEEVRRNIAVTQPLLWIRKSGDQQ